MELRLFAQLGLKFPLEGTGRDRREAFPGLVRKGEWPVEGTSWTDEGYCRCGKCVGGVGEVMLHFCFSLE